LKRSNSLAVKAGASKISSLGEFEELLSPGRGINSRISQALEDLPKNSAVLFIVGLKDYSTVLAELLRILQARKQQGNGAYLTVNKPVEDLAKAFSRNKISTGSVFFIDAISILSGRKASSGKKAMFLDSPTDLIDMDNAISKQLSKSQKLGFVVFDSLSTLLLYNKPQAVEKFLHVLVGKIRGANVQVFLITVKSSEHAGLIETVSQFVDKVVEIS